VLSFTSVCIPIKINNYDLLQLKEGKKNLENKVEQEVQNKEGRKRIKIRFCEGR